MLRPILLLLIALPYTAFANPGSRDPAAALSGHGLGGDSKPLIAKCEALWKDNIEVLKEIIAAGEAREIDKVSYRAISKCCFAGRDIQWYADELIDMGEPAGIELRMRGDYMWGQGHRGAEFYLSTERGKKLTAAAFKALNNAMDKREKIVQKVSGLLSDGKLQAASDVYRSADDDLWQEMLWIHHSQRPPYRKSFDAVYQALQNPWRKERKQSAAERLKQVLASQTPNLDAVVAQLTDAIASIGQTGSCEIDGTAATGPQAFEAFFAKWQMAHVGLVRCQGIYWALQNLGAVSAQGHGPWTQTATDWATKMSGLLPQLIVADAGRLTEAEAANRYMQYIDVIAPLALRTQSSKLSEAVEPALQQLLQTAPQGLALVDRYRRATDDMLAWRARLATAQANQLNAGSPALANLFVQANESSDDYQGLFEKHNNRIHTATLRTPAATLLQISMPKMMDASVRIDDLSLPSAGGRFTLSAYRDRVFANVPANIDLTTQVEALKKDLLVGESQPPLSLYSKMALDSAAAIDLSAIGGTIKGLYLEPVIARFAAFPTAAAPLFPMPTLPGSGEAEDRTLNLNQMLMRFDVLPQWVQHRYFVADLSN